MQRRMIYAIRINVFIFCIINQFYGYAMISNYVL